MTEWEVVGVLIALAGLIATVVKPVVKLTETVAKLTTAVERLSDDMTEQRKRSMTAHEKLWAHNDEQDARLSDHETRIRLLEEGEEN